MRQSRSEPFFTVPVLFIALFCLSMPAEAQFEDVETAIENIGKATDLLIPDGHNGRIYKGYLFQLHGMYPEAAGVFRSILRNKPGSPAARYGLAMVHVQRSEYLAANNHLLKLVENNPEFMACWKQLGLVDIFLGNLNRAEEHLLKAQRLAPRNRDVLLLLGRVYAMRGDSATQAIKSLRAAYRDYADDPEINVELGTLYYNTGNYPVAIYFFDKAMKLGLDTNQLRLALAKSYYYQGKPREAADLLKKLLTADRDNAEAALYLGASYLKLEQWAQAYNFLQRAHRLDPGQDATLFYLAYAQKQQGILKPAILNAVKFRSRAVQNEQLDPALLVESMKLILAIETAMGVERLPSQQPDNMEQMVGIRGGTVKMQTAGEPLDYTVEPFYLSRHEVSKAEYKVFVEITGWAVPSGGGGGKARPLLVWNPDGSLPEGTGELPVVFVSWEDAMAYAAWAGKRLPTELEWQIAAGDREAGRFPWGDGVPGDHQARYDSDAGPRPVAEGAATEAGLVNIVGNAAEWCMNVYLDNLSASINATWDAPTKTPRAYRGGHWRSEAKELEITNRNGLPGGSRNAFLGFRLASDVTEEKK